MPDPVTSPAVPLRETLAAALVDALEWDWDDRTEDDPTVPTPLEAVGDAVTAALAHVGEHLAAMLRDEADRLFAIVGSTDEQDAAYKAGLRHAADLIERACRE